MQVIKIDPGLQNSLCGLTGQVLLCDSKGNALGFFQPMAEPCRIEDLRLESPLSMAELQERRKNRTGKTLEEILHKWGL